MADHQKIDDEKPRFVDHSFTDSSLWPYKSFRSTRFIQSTSFLNSNINYEIVSRAIEYSDFFGTDSERVIRCWGDGKICTSHSSYNAHVRPELSKKVG